MTRAQQRLAAEICEKVRKRLLKSYRNHCTNVAKPDVVRLGPDEYEAVTAVLRHFNAPPKIHGLDIAPITRPGVRVGCKKRVDTGLPGTPRTHA